MTKAHEIYRVVESLTQGTGVQTTVNLPYVTQDGTRYRQFDVVYSAGKLTVNVEVQLGKKVMTGNEQTHLVTPQQNGRYKKTRADLCARLGLDPILFEIAFIEGPVVDNYDDTELLTTRVRRVLAQYGPINTQTRYQQSGMHAAIAMRFKGIHRKHKHSGIIGPCSADNQPLIRESESRERGKLYITCQAQDIGLEEEVVNAFRHGLIADRASRQELDEAMATVGANLSIRLTTMPS